MDAMNPQFVAAIATGTWFSRITQSALDMVEVIDAFNPKHCHNVGVLLRDFAISITWTKSRQRSLLGEHFDILAPVIFEEDSLTEFGGEIFHFIGYCHDLGKAEDSDLYSMGRFGPVEHALKREHPVKSVACINALAATTTGFPAPDSEISAAAFLFAKSVVESHHERLDGRGYPRGLTGDQVVLGALICSVCDVYEAICSPRPSYDGGVMGHGEALAITNSMFAAGGWVHRWIYEAFLLFIKEKE